MRLPHSIEWVQTKPQQRGTLDMKKRCEGGGKKEISMKNNK